MNFAVIDFETGSRKQESAIAVGLVKYAEGEPAGSYYSLIRPPELYVWRFFTERVHGLTVDDVKDAPMFSEIWPEVRDFAGGLPIAAHNVRFDKSVLTATLAHYSINAPEWRWFDSVTIARKTWPRLANHRLTTLGEHLGIKYKAHHALEDCETCGKVILNAAKKLKVNTLQDLLAKTGA